MLFRSKKQVFNEKHNIKIYGYDVELYAQDTEESHYSTGVYSIMNDEWVNEPKKMNVDVDKELLKTKIKCWTDKIDHVIKTSTIEDDKELLSKVKDKLKEYRKSGLEKEGELSYENLVFKFLRRSGHIQKLFDTTNKMIDKDLSVEAMIKEEIEKTPQDILNNSKFLTSLSNQVDNQVKYEYTPGQKIPYEPDVELLQTGLQLLGFSLPKWGIDGKFGPETRKAVTDFQASVGLEETGRIEKNDLEKMLIDEHLDGEGDDEGETDREGSGSGENGKGGRPKLSEEEKKQIRDEIKEAVMAAAQTCQAGQLPAEIGRAHV